MSHAVPRSEVGAAAPTTWLPASPCTPGCLVTPGGGATRGRARVAVRLSAVVVVLLTAVVTAPLCRGRTRRRWLRALSRAMLRAAGIRLRVIPRDGGAARWSGGLVVANHLSWIDVLALAAVAPVRVVAKREVADWPLVGGLARRTDALFIDRAGLRALPVTVSAVAAALRDGGCVAVFPEGTTWCGAAAGSFRRAAFQAALDADAPVLPVAIVFRLADGSPARSAAFVGAQSLFDSMLRVVRTPGLTCELSVMPPLPPDGDRRTLARRAERAISTATGVRHGRDRRLSAALAG